MEGVDPTAGAVGPAGVAQAASNGNMISTPASSLTHRFIDETSSTTIISSLVRNVQSPN